MIEKILSELQVLKEDAVDKWDGGASHRAYTKAIEIVQEVAKDGGWIPCSERLPEIGERVLLWVYGRVHIGKRIDAKMFEEYDIFSLENKTNESTKRIEAWMPLPITPYQKGE